MIDKNDDWYVAQLKPNGFRRAITNLNRQNFDTFYAYAPENNPPCTSTQGGFAANFPGYIFVRFGSQNSD